MKRITFRKGTQMSLSLVVAAGLSLSFVSTPAQAAANLQVHSIDVGQADAFLIQLPNGQNMMIDAGNNADSSLVVDYLKTKGITRLDYVVGTHPHEDHIGGLDYVINTFSIGKVYMPSKTSTTITYTDVIKAINAKGLTVTKAIKGLTMFDTTVDGQTLSAVMVAPVKETYSNTNDHSAVIRLQYGSTSFLFTGDAEVTAETDIVNSGQYITSNLLKVGHHGSSTSTTSAFLNKVNPSAAFISVGTGNSYGHPATTTIDRLKSNGIKIYRTDVQGTIIFTTSGIGWLVNKTPWWQ